MHLETKHTNSDEIFMYRARKKQTRILVTYKFLFLLFCILSIFEILSNFFSVYWDNLMISVFDYIYMVNYTYRFTRIKPFLHLWNGTNLVMINDNLDVILNMFCTYFIEDFFCI